MWYLKVPDLNFKITVKYISYNIQVMSVLILTCIYVCCGRYGDCNDTSFVEMISVNDNTTFFYSLRWHQKSMFMVNITKNLWESNVDVYKKVSLGRTQNCNFKNTIENTQISKFHITNDNNISSSISPLFFTTKTPQFNKPSHVWRQPYLQRSYLVC